MKNVTALYEVRCLNCEYTILWTYDEHEAFMHGSVDACCPNCEENAIVIIDTTIPEPDTCTVCGGPDPCVLDAEGPMCVDCGWEKEIDSHAAELPDVPTRVCPMCDRVCFMLHWCEPGWACKQCCDTLAAPTLRQRLNSRYWSLRLRVADVVRSMLCRIGARKTACRWHITISGELPF